MWVTESTAPWPAPRGTTTMNNTTASTADALVATGIRVAYGSREVLHGIDLNIQPGRIHALLGANGSGKSTMVKVLTGRMQPTAGTLTIGGQVRRIGSPIEANASGIRAVQQETPMIDGMSIAENFAMRTGYPTGALGHIRWKAVHRHTAELLARIGLDLDPSALASTVSAADRGLLAVGMALDNGIDGSRHEAKVLILDEATASIPEDDALAVLRSVRHLADEGLAVLMVTHRISEATDFADDMTTIYNGDVAYSGTAKLDPDRIIELIVTGHEGTESKAEVAPKNLHPVEDDHAIVVTGLRTKALKDVSFHLNSGEIVGIVGGPRSGADQVAAAIAGLVGGAKGTIMIGGATQSLPKGPKAALRANIALVPRDRLRQGGIGVFSLFENIVLPTARGLRYLTAGRRRLAQGVLDDFAVTPNSQAALFKELSGGNQQKVIVGKWLTRQPRLLILDDPTVGVDPGARRIMFDAVAEKCRSDGLVVLLLSSEPEEIVRHCHRVLAVQDGQIVEELAGDQIDQLTVSGWANK